ncbi:MAG TPA: NAD(P)-binding domain-containing protein, partial [bacterium]|nr:NAD(P)-binding domain-containing protein [bacterium]
MSRIGFIGLGVMGKPMSRNLMKAGHSLTVYDVLRESVDELVAAGAARGESSSDVAKRAEIVITMLPDGPQVEEAVLGPRGVLEGAHAGLVVIDMSSVSPLVSQRVARECAARQVEFLDAPVSGGEPKAVDGTLAIMVGGNPGLFERVAPVLRAMGSSVFLMGPVGAGNVTKL